MITTADKNKAREMSVALRPEVNTLLLAMTVAKMERKKCDAIQRRELAGQNYAYARGDDDRKGFIRDPKHAWLMSDFDAANYWRKIDAEYRRAGYVDLPEGHCPALIAERMQVEAEWALIAAAEKFFPGITNDKLLCGTGKGDGLETRRKYIDLLIGLVVNAPGYRSPLGKSGDCCGTVNVD